MALTLWQRIIAGAVQRAGIAVARPSRALFFASHTVADPTEVRVPTRHGEVSCWIYRPPTAARAEAKPGSLPPAHLQIHGGAFVIRTPKQDTHVAEYIASDVGAVVVLVDHDAVPDVAFPVIEEQCFDVWSWMQRSGRELGWDPTRMTVGGGSVGGKFAVNVCQLAAREGAVRPLAVYSAFPYLDATVSDRTSPTRFPMIPRLIQRAVAGAYYLDIAERSSALASPVLDNELAEVMPPTLVMTGEYDTLAADAERLAAILAGAGVRVTHRVFPADHGFYNFKPAAIAREAIELVGEHLRRAHSRSAADPGAST